MGKTQVSQWDIVAANNTELNNIPIDGAVTTPSQVDNLFREVMAQIKTFSTTVTLTVGVSVDNTVPRFDGIAGALQTSGVTITDTNAMTIVGTSTGTLLTLENTDATANPGPSIVGFRNSASPAASDYLSSFQMQGKDSAGNTQVYAEMRGVIVDPTSTSEDARLEFVTVVAGTYAERANIGAGLHMAGAADPGAGKINATDVQINGKSVATDTISGFIGAPADKSYTLVLKCPFGGTINETVTKSASGTCTATFKINTTALGGTANSVSSSEQTQAQASANTFVAGDDIVVTISSNSSCVDMAFTIKVTKAF